MKTDEIIHVDFEVWRELQTRRATKAMTENDVLRNVLGLSRPPKQSPPPNGGVSRTGQEVIIRSGWQKLKVIFADGTEISDKRVVMTFIRAIEKIGPERVSQLRIFMAGERLVSAQPRKKSESWKPLSGGYHVYAKSSTNTKLKQLKRIGRELGENFRVELV